MAWSFTHRQCRQNASNQRMTRAADRIALANIMRSGVKACRWAEVQSGTRFLSEHYFRRFYRVGSAVGRCFHGAVHGLVSTCE